jgi:endonuclease/exonuclease/phosphatase family metal-dependent hydrolase
VTATQVPVSKLYRKPLQVKLLTLNTHKGFTTFNRRFVLHELRDAVRASGADVVFLQEVLGRHEKHSRRANWPKTSQYEFLADSIWTDFAYGQNSVYTHGHHGNALLSKFPILRHQNHDVSLRKRDRRGLLHCVIDLPEQRIELHAICVHLGLVESHRRSQLERICMLVNSAVPPDAPLIVAGDFNDWRLRASTTLERCAGLQEVFIAAGGRCARTFPARWPLLRLDRMYFRNVRVLRTEVLCSLPWSHLSDHAALAADVELAQHQQPALVVERICSPEI